MIQVANKGYFSNEKLQAVVLDWAGTTVDYGSRAPIQAILAAFEQVGVPVSEAEARRPMGRAKRDHLVELLEIPEVANRWIETKGVRATSQDVDHIYKNFLRIQTTCLVEYSKILPGCVEAIHYCRSMGMKIGSSTGYTRELLEKVAERASGEGYSPDLMLAADDGIPGRPSPWLCIENAKRLGVNSMALVLKVDDTPSGVTAGRNAGVWSVGIIRTGNEVGMSQEALEMLSENEQQALFDTASKRLEDAGAHYLIDSIADLPAIIEKINERLSEGATP